MNTNKIWTVFAGVLLLLQVAAEGLMSMILIKLNVLPEKFVIILLTLLVLLTALTAGLFFLRGKNPVSKTRRVVAWALAILIIILCMVGAKFALDTYETLQAVTDHDDQTDIHNMYVLVRTDDPAQSLKDTAAYRYAIINEYDMEHVQNAVMLVESYTGSTLDVTAFERTAELADAIINAQVDAVITNGAAIALLMEEEKYEDFLQKVRFLHAIPLNQLEETEPSTEPPTEPSVELSITEAPFIVYLSGSDTRNKKLRISRSDVNILVVVNPVSKQILLLNTPRDYYVPNPKGNGRLDKLTHCGLYGPECSMKALGDLYDLQADYYAQINFDGFETLVDAVGGVTVYSDQSFTSRGVHIKKGENELNGEEALVFARERYHVSGGDNGRGKNQMKVITAIIEKMTTGTTILSKYSSILKSLEGMFKTSISMDDVSMLVKMQLEDMSSWNIQSFAATGRGGSEKTYSSPGHRAYVMYPDKNSVAHATNLVKRVIAGEILTQADMKVPE